MGRCACIIMAGGSGERFWPLSRPSRPKQLLRLTDPTMTMLEEAVRRVEPLFEAGTIYIATSTPFRQAIVEEGVLPETSIFTEPARRNTLGAQCWVVANLLAAGQHDATLAILTSDHLIGEPVKFLETVRTALELAQVAGGIVTIGISPNRPETGYGYIEEDSQHQVTSPEGRRAAKALSFREKPSIETAERFLESGNFLWNSGMFFYTIDSFLKELEFTQPAVHKETLAVANALEKGDVKAAITHFEQLPNLSVDFAVMERAQNVYVLRADFPWDDVGAWDAIERTREMDAFGNVVEGRVVLSDSHGCIALGLHPTVTVGVLGLTDMVIVMSDEAVLVCHKKDVQRVRLLAQLHENSK